MADIVSSSPEGPFLAAAKARGITTVGGLGMLLHQDRAGFEAWFGVRPKVEDDIWDAMTSNLIQSGGRTAEQVTFGNDRSNQFFE